jgi:hypothetical protein
VIPFFNQSGVAATVLTRKLAEIASIRSATASLARVISLAEEFAAMYAASASGIPLAAKPHQYSQRSYRCLERETL